MLFLRLLRLLELCIDISKLFYSIIVEEKEEGTSWFAVVLTSRNNVEIDFSIFSMYVCMYVRT